MDVICPWFYLFWKTYTKLLYWHSITSLTVSSSTRLPPCLFLLPSLLLLFNCDKKILYWLMLPTNSNGWCTIFYVISSGVNFLMLLIKSLSPTKLCCRLLTISSPSLFIADLIKTPSQCNVSHLPWSRLLRLFISTPCDCGVLMALNSSLISIL